MRRSCVDFALSARRRSRRLGLEPLAARLPCDAAGASLGPELESSELEPSELATAFVYELNRVRFDPPAYATRAARPAEWEAIPSRPPLALNPLLTAAAESHAAAMAEGDFLSHRNPLTGSEPHERLRQAGYELPASLGDDGNAVELIAAGRSLLDAEAVLKEWLDDLTDPARSRRNHLLGVSTPQSEEALLGASEIGVGFCVARGSSLENYWAVEIARPHEAGLFLTGVVFADADGDASFDAGEGLGGVTVSSGPLVTTTDASGAYRLPAGGGIHRLRISGGAVEKPAEQLVGLDDQNVQVDFPAGAEPQVNFRQRSLWTHPTEHLDVNRNGVIQPLDALLMINLLNLPTPPALAEVPAGRPEAYYDTNGDGRLSPLDVLLVVNHLNRSPAS
ncbi:dockerin type I domain-containing protein [Candidatus Laterigemmans baculatus]|uniref:dockerin type I domain-containing protein n=1 Tax=Candidatus Laterigemmans baculatus TaxID=2770505 RepID=UPI0013DA8109|nr:dockerin type I domain-containing protein [Candidatus Laterigemmans baculatus]